MFGETFTSLSPSFYFIFPIEWIYIYIILTKNIYIFIENSFKFVVYHHIDVNDIHKKEKTRNDNKKENKIDNEENINVYHVEITEKQENIKKEME